MKVFNVGEFKAQFSSILDLVKQGEPVSLAYGRSKKQVAVLIPFQDYKQKKGIRLGALQGKASYKMDQDFELDEETFLAS